MDEVTRLLHLLEEQAEVEAEAQLALELHVLAESYSSGDATLEVVSKMLYPYIGG